MNNSNIFAFVPVATLVVILCSLAMMNSCEKTTDDGGRVYEPITLVQPDSVVASIKQKEALPLEIKFTTDRPIVYALGLFSIDSTKSGQFDITKSDTIFRIYDSIPKENKKTYSGSFTLDSAKAGYKVRVKIMMQALGNSGLPEPTHYFEKYIRFDVVR